LDVTITVIEQIEAKKRELEQRAQDLEEELQTSSSRSQAATTALLQQQGELEAATTQLQSNLQVWPSCS
jgi:chromosome segregation ATPase